MATALENMNRAIETYKARNPVYGDNYKHFGEVMTALFPKGVKLSTKEDWNRFGVLVHIVSKLSRYTTRPQNGHADSIHDLGVYAFMLEELDAAYCEHVYTDGKTCAACGQAYEAPLTFPTAKIKEVRQ